MSFLTTPRPRRLVVFVLLGLFVATGLFVANRRTQAAGTERSLFAPLTQFAQRTQQSLIRWIRPANNANAPVTAVTPMFATITVTNTNDSGAGSLRQAILTANGSMGTDTISFSLGAGTPTINLLSALPTITDSVIINGNTGGATRVELRDALFR